MKRILFAILLFCAASLSAWAAPAGEITHLSGILSVKKADGTAKILSIKSSVEEGDVLSTEAETYARIKFVDGGEVVLRPNSQLKVNTYRYDAAKPQNDGVFLSMFKGGLRAVTGLVGKRNQDKVSFQTPTATIGIRGTHLGALFCQNDCAGVPTPSGQTPPNGLYVDVSSGAVLLSNPGGSLLLNAGQFGFVPGVNQPPLLLPPAQGPLVGMPGSISNNRGGGAGIGSDSAADCTM